MTDTSPEGWGEYRKLILSEQKRMLETLDTLNEKIDRLRLEDLGKLQQEIALLKLQAAMWGGAAGAGLTAVFALATRFIK